MRTPSFARRLWACPENTIPPEKEKEIVSWLMSEDSGRLNKELLTEVYGNHIISGQQEIYGGGNNGNYELEFDWIYNLTGKVPAIRGFDFMNYNPLYGWEDGTTDRMIDWVNNRAGIATAAWHINVPRDFAAYQLGEFVDWKDATYKPTETNLYIETVICPFYKITERAR